MDISLGRCHFGGEDVATMTAVRAAGTGWVAVCERHRERAETEGFIVRAPTLVLDEVVSPSSRDPEPEPVQPEREPVHDRAPEAEAEARAERRVVVGALSLGRWTPGRGWQPTAMLQECRTVARRRTRTKWGFPAWWCGR